MEFIKKNKNEFFKLNVLNKYMENHKGFIAGGVFKNIFKNKPFKDIDIFFYKEDDFNEALDLFIKDSEYIKLYENKSAVCFKKGNIKIDLVRSVFDTPENIISNFDFTITKMVLHKNKTKEGVEYNLSYVKNFFEHLLLNKLVIDNKLLFPVSTFERTYRYKKYGYGLCRESKAKLIESLKNANTQNLSNDLYFGFD